MKLVWANLDCSNGRAEIVWEGADGTFFVARRGKDGTWVDGALPTSFPFGITDLEENFMSLDLSYALPVTPEELAAEALAALGSLKPIR